MQECVPGYNPKNRNTGFEVTGIVLCSVNSKNPTKSESIGVKPSSLF